MKSKICTWNVDNVLEMLETWWPLPALSLKDLTLKVSMLMALLSGQRCQTLHALDIDHMRLTEKSCTFFISDLLKHSRRGTHQAPIELLAFSPKPELCIVKHIHAYLDCTSKLRCSENKLFISLQKPHKRVSKDTIARWIKTVLKMAGIDPSVYSAHSTRAASTSHASSIGVPTTAIMEAAGWSRESTFTKFYKKTATSNFGQSIIENYFKSS